MIFLQQLTSRSKSSLALFLAVVTLFSTGQKSYSETQYGDLARRVTGMLEEEHFLRQPFNDKMSARVLESYLEILDYSRIYFTKEDVDGFRRDYELLIDDYVRNESIPAAYEIYAVYEKRLQDRVELAKSLAKPDTFTYDSDRFVEISRKESEWATAGEAHDQLWRNLIEGDLIREKLIADAVAKEEAKKAKEAAEKGETLPEKKKTDEDKKTIYEKVSDRYDRILKRIGENETEDVATLFIKSIARAYDPHSEYFSQQQYDNFRIGMNKSLTGIGAMLQKDEEQGGATIEGLVVGGPAAKGGVLEVKDRVIGVAQGTDGEFVDVVEKKLSDIVDLIRGEIGTTVRLKVVPAVEATDIKFIDIVRETIDLKDSLATADLIITKDPMGEEQKLGWITLPSFYADMDGGNTSTTTDVRRLLTRLAIEGMDGLVVDLRDNGGGSLEEAINMTGLFIRKGPVVQSIDWRGNREQKFSRNANAVYGGPMIVLINRASASASEIFAAALQDTGRAVIVGGQSSFGKGTVQQLRPVLTNRIILPFNRETTQQGALKLTIQTFYRINGHSTQRDGVVPEVQLPSLLDIAEIGEATLPNALEVDPIQPSRYDPFFEKPLPYDSLQRASNARVASRTGFGYILHDVETEKERIENNKISLNLEERKAEAAKAEEDREKRKQERIERFAEIREKEKGLFTIYKLTQDNVLEEGLTLRDELSQEELSGMSRGANEEEEPEDKLLEYPHKFDPYERETIQIMQDLIAIRKTGNPVNISEAKPEKRDKTIPLPVGQPN
ncbi:carboxy terminal-processing peptidase [Verrucomicrobiales bacterium BCK34]|nr:carboxy terminal-processing peptidase [Verrucomicrobiales bacterium BCK34]